MKKLEQKSITALFVSAMCVPFLLAACGKSNSPEVKALALEQTLATMSTKDEVAKACDKFEDEQIERRKAMIELQKQYPPFRIQGDIKDNDPNSVQVWGVAFIPPQTGVQHWANSHAQRNIVVLNPKNEVGNPSYYSGLHWFVNKDTGRNGFGADVPVWVFGPPPDEIKKAIAAGDVLNANQRVCIKRWKELEAAQTEKPSAPSAKDSALPQQTTSPSNLPPQASSQLTTASTDQMNTAIAQIANARDEECRSAELQSIYQKSACGVVTVEQLSDDAVITKEEVGLFEKVRSRTQERRQNAIGAFRSHGGVKGVEVARLYERVGSLADGNASDLAKGVITWGSYNKRRKELEENIREESAKIWRGD